MDSNPIKDSSRLIRRVEGAIIQCDLELINQNLNKGDTTHFVSRAFTKEEEREYSQFSCIIVYPYLNENDAFYRFTRLNS